jgi:hypothetical protein
MRCRFFQVWLMVAGNDVKGESAIIITTFRLFVCFDEKLLNLRVLE